MPAFENLISSVDIKPSVLAMVDKELMEQRFIMPVDFEEESGILTIVTSNYQEVITDIAMISEIIAGKNDGNVKGLRVESVTYENLTAGYSYHYKQAFTPANQSVQKAVSTERAITTEQQKKPKKYCAKLLT